jgi:isoquinoline 1-oxidoreductase beta subunit
MHLTGGSNSIKNSYTQYRELGARTRAMLVSAAAAQWKVDASSLKTGKRRCRRPRRQEARLWRAGRGGDEAARARQGDAQGPEAIPASSASPPAGSMPGAKSSGQQSYGIDMRCPAC